MKCWPCRSITPSDQFQAFFIEYSNTTIFAWTLDVSQLKKQNKKQSVKQKFRLIYIQEFSDSDLLKWSHSKGRINGSKNCL